MTRRIDFIVVHCTATPQNTKVQSILNYWKNVLKWSRPGYHFVIEADGNVVKLQDIEEPTNGVAGFNRNSVHVSYIGGIDRSGKPIDNRTPEQKKAMTELLTKVRNQITLNQRTFPIIQGHKDFPGVKKACPSFDAKKEFEKL